MSRADWVSLVAAEGGLAELRSALEALADHPGHIRTSGAADEFLVPPYLAERYMPAPKRRSTKKDKEDDV